MGNEHTKGGGAKRGKKDATKLARFQADPTQPIEKFYEISDTVLGKGNFSVVKLGTHKASGQKVAVKIVSKLNAGVLAKPEMLQTEVEILSKVDHPNIIALIDMFDTNDTLYLVMELVTGGELFDRIVEREQYHEAEAAIVIAQLFDALAYLHDLGIVHRDLKPENLLLENREEDTPIRLTDFGLSKIYTTEMMQTACGTPGYVAPEILDSAGYDSAVDLWATGVILYILLCGYPPFYNENPALLFESIMKGEYQFHSPYWDDISADAKDLIKKLLVVDPAKRLTAKQGLEHPWIQNASKKKSKTPLPAEMRKNLKDHNVDRKSSPSLVNLQNEVKKKKDVKKDKERKDPKKKK